MDDLLYVGLIALLFVACWGYTRLCEALGRQS